MDRIVIIVHGGLVQEVYSEVPVDVLLVDYDVDDMEVAVDIKGELATVGEYSITIDAETVEDYFKKA